MDLHEKQSCAISGAHMTEYSYIKYIDNFIVNA